jgi:hypothetical protein
MECGNNPINVGMGPSFINLGDTEIMKTRRFKQLLSYRAQNESGRTFV